ncbi:hypothetical protein CapIbe_009682 [Capra ibex]
MPARLPAVPSSTSLTLPRLRLISDAASSWDPSSSAWSLPVSLQIFRKTASPAAQKQAGGVQDVRQPEARQPGRHSPLGKALSPLWGCRGAVKT